MYVPVGGTYTVTPPGTVRVKYPPKTQIFVLNIDSQIKFLNTQ